MTEQYKKTTMTSKARDRFVVEVCFTVLRGVEAGWFKATTRRGVRKVALLALKHFDTTKKYRDEWDAMADWIAREVAGTLELKKRARRPR